jgi:surface antigen
MKTAGWYILAPWCAFLAKLIWTEGFQAEEPGSVHLIQAYSSGNAIDTYRNYARSKEFHVSQTPTVGSLVIWEEGNSQFGHAGVVIEIVDSETIKTVEGNTNNDGSREGYLTAIKTRKIHLAHGPGLNLMGFVHPIRIA